MHDISLKPTEKNGKIDTNGSLTLEGTVKTYRYLDEEEQAAAAAASAPAAPTPAKPAAPAASPAGGK
jgi:type IV pilus assembly protein PilO